MTSTGKTRARHLFQRAIDAGVDPDVVADLVAEGVTLADVADSAEAGVEFGAYLDARESAGHLEALERLGLGSVAHPAGVDQVNSIGGDTATYLAARARGDGHRQALMASVGPATVRRVSQDPTANGPLRLIDHMGVAAAELVAAEVVERLAAAMNRHGGWPSGETTVALNPSALVSGFADAAIAVAVLGGAPADVAASATPDGFFVTSDGTHVSIAPFLSRPSSG